MDPHHAARLLAIGRMLVGALLVSAPSVASRAMGGGRPPASASLFVRAMGARDLALGAGAVAALADGRDAARWVRMGAAADAADAAAVLLAGRELGAVGTAAGTTIASAAAGVGFRTAAALDA